jgi:superfamily I DNA/RNA helicase
VLFIRFTPYFDMFLGVCNDPFFRYRIRDEREEFLALERRTMFVGMTRAMRALLVAIPERAQSPLFSGFEGDYWNTGE